MKKIILTLICLFICLQANAKQLRFAQVSDIYYSENNLNTQHLLDWVVKSINIKNPQFVVFLGNSIDKSKEKDEIEFLKTIKSLKMPYYIVLGNHDVHKLSGMTKEDFWKNVRKYNKNNKSKQPYYVFSKNKDIICIVLDGTVPFAPTTHGDFTKEQLSWLDKTLSKNKNKKVMIFQHFPIEEPSENPSYTILNKEDYKSVISKHNNIISISSGHYHVEKVTVDEKEIYHISTPALNKPDFVYNIITVDYNKFPFGKVKIKDVSVDSVKLQ